LLVKLISKYTLILCADEYGQFLANNLFHHPDKGCNLESIITSTGHGQNINQFCHTHEKLCSKTGWEIHHYMGNKNVETYNKTCCHCGAKFIANNHRLNFCASCANLVHKLEKEQWPNNAPV